MTDYDVPMDVYEAYIALDRWQPVGKWNQKMRRKALKHLGRATITGEKPAR